MKSVLPEPLKVVRRRIRHRLMTKDEAQFAFWKSRLEIDGGRFQNSHYERLMLGMAEESNTDFLTGEVVADFGCGPRGSLVWASSARMRIGIDVLANSYAEEFTSNILSHGMIYLQSTERVIPLPSDFVDVMFTLNALDSVENFPSMCLEIIRVIRAGGLFVGGFNLEEPRSPSQPLRLTETSIKRNLLDHLDVQSYRVTRRRASDVDAPLFEYAPFFEEKLSYTPGEQGLLWVRAKKPAPRRERLASEVQPLDAALRALLRENS